MKEKGSSPVNDKYVLDHIDYLEEIIGDDDFSNFLNTKAEVQTGNDIYKYTDVGLFIAKETGYKRLENYLEVREISGDLLVPTSYESKKKLFETAKLGFGYNFESDSNFHYTIEMFKKSKTYYTNGISDIDYNYPADGYGISMGITF